MPVSSTTTIFPTAADNDATALLMLQDVLFDPTTYKCQSKHHNLIAVSVDVGLLLRVLRGACANNSECLEVKLTQRAVAVAGGGDETQSKPFLSFQGRVRRGGPCIIQIHITVC